MNEQPVQLNVDKANLQMIKGILQEKLIRWKCALAAAEESSPSSAANCWVSGYLYGLKEALDLFNER